MSPDECRKELKACPFCSHPDPLYSNYGSDGHIIACSLCLVSTGFWPTKGAVFDNWNRRTESKPVTREWAFQVLCDQSLSFEDRVGKVLDALQLSPPQSPVVPGVELTGLVRYSLISPEDDPMDTDLFPNPKGQWVRFSDIENALAISGRESREDGLLKKDLDDLQRKAFNEYVDMANRYREALVMIANNPIGLINPGNTWQDCVSNIQIYARQALATTNAKEPS